MVKENVSRRSHRSAGWRPWFSCRAITAPLSPALLGKGSPLLYYEVVQSDNPSRSSCHRLETPKWGMPLRYLVCYVGFRVRPGCRRDSARNPTASSNAWSMRQAPLWQRYFACSGQNPFDRRMRSIKQLGYLLKAVACFPALPHQGLWAVRVVGSRSILPLQHSFCSRSF